MRTIVLQGEPRFPLTPSFGLCVLGFAFGLFSLGWFGLCALGFAFGLFSLGWFGLCVLGFAFGLGLKSS
jgi:hypothetical protein